MVCAAILLNLVASCRALSVARTYGGSSVNPENARKVLQGSLSATAVARIHDDCDNLPRERIPRGKLFMQSKLMRLTVRTNSLVTDVYDQWLEVASARLASLRSASVCFTLTRAHTDRLRRLVRLLSRTFS